MKNPILLIKTILINAVIFLFPLFFLTATQEFFVTNKLYFLAFGALALLLISTIEFIVTKKIVWEKNPLDNILVLFPITVALSVVIASPNKVQAILNQNFGLLAIFSLTILAYYILRAKNTLMTINIMQVASLIVSFITIIFFFDPFKNTNLPTNLAFLKNPGFNTFGGQLDLIIFLGFFAVFNLSRFFFDKNKKSTNHLMLNVIYSVFNLVALVLSIYYFIKHGPFYLTPYNISWFSAVEILKNPVSALFGTGIDNFASVFSRMKDLAYNQTNVWTISSFIISRSTLLHIMTEAGLFGIAAFVILVLELIRRALNKKTDHNQSCLVKNPLCLNVIYIILIVLFFPPSLVTFFLFFVLLALVASENKTDVKDYGFDVSNLLPIYIGMITISFIFIGISCYFLSRVYLAEYYFKKSLDGYINNSAKEVYDNQRVAITYNPYLEKYRLNFAQTNIMIANNLASKPQDKITDQDKQNIAQAIQAAIAEGKAVVTLNPQKANSWANLAEIYRNLLYVAQGADAWTVSSYQRAITLDPQNPTYRLNLGGVYYSLRNFDEAIRFFETAAALKPDWSNAHYNLAWAAFQKGNYQNAVAEMQSTLSLINIKDNRADYEKAQKDLEEFKKKLPQESLETSPSAEQQPNQLSLPNPPAATLEPKIKLPKEASPEAR